MFRHQLNLSASLHVDRSYYCSIEGSVGLSINTADPQQPLYTDLLWLIFFLFWFTIFRLIWLILVLFKPHLLHPLQAHPPHPAHPHFPQAHPNHPHFLQAHPAHPQFLQAHPAHPPPGPLEQIRSYLVSWNVRMCRQYCPVSECYKVYPPKVTHGHPPKTSKNHRSFLPPAFHRQSQHISAHLMWYHWKRIWSTPVLPAFNHSPWTFQQHPQEIHPQKNILNCNYTTDLVFFQVFLSLFVTTQGSSTSAVTSGTSLTVSSGLAKEPKKQKVPSTTCPQTCQNCIFSAFCHISCSYLGYH